MKPVWNEIKADELPAMFAVDPGRTPRALQQAQLNNFQRWPILETYVWPNYEIPGSYAGEIDYLESLADARASRGCDRRSIPDRHGRPRFAPTNALT